MLGYGDTHAGLNRKNNQDFIFICNEDIGIFSNLYIVADGIGGHKAGEIASKNAIGYFVEFIQKLEINEEDKEDKEDKEDEIDVLDILVSGMNYANDKVLSLSKTSDDFEGMGTTFLVATIFDDKFYIGHIGDCRVYSIRENKIKQVTTDHTKAIELFKNGVITKEEAKVSRDSSVLTRALGIDENIKTDALIFKMEQEDNILMCSDGLSDMLSEDEIMEIINMDIGIENKADTLISRANENGGKDNISVIVIQP